MDFLIGIGIFSSAVVGNALLRARTRKNDVHERGQDNFIGSLARTDGSVKLQLRSRFRGANHSARIVCCRCADDYEQCIDALIGPSDRVLIMHAISDSKDRAIQKIKSATQTALFFTGRNVWDISSMQSMGVINVIVIDYSDYFGNFLLCDSLTLIRVLCSVFESDLRTIIVKSKGLTRHAHAYTTIGRHLSLLKKRDGCCNNKLGKYQNPVVICAVGVGEYRSAIESTVRKGDKVLEIGCARGTTVALISRYIGDDGLCIGVDIGKVCVERARKDNATLLQTHRNVRFEVADAWDIPGLLALNTEFNVIFVDVGGISGVDGESEGLALMRLLMCAYNSTNPNSQLRSIIVKSQCLRDHASRFCTAFDLLAQLKN
jgi:hypothetical protein